MTTHIDPCFLCQSPARWEATHASLRHYQCSSPSCGEYEVSLGAMEQLDGNTTFKRTASAIAAGLADPGKILEIRTSDETEASLQVQVVPRRHFLGGLS